MFENHQARHNSMDEQQTFSPPEVCVGMYELIYTPYLPLSLLLLPPPPSPPSHPLHQQARTHHNLAQCNSTIACGL